MSDTPTMGSHWEGCESEHDKCMIAKLQRDLAARDAELARGREDKEMLRDALVKESQYRQETERQRAALEADRDLWKEAVLEGCIVRCIYCAAHDTDPCKALNDCAVWDQQIALDPSVSKEARELRDTYKAERNALRRLALLLAHQLFHSQPHFNYRKSNLHVKRFLARILGKQVMSGLSAKTQGPAVRVLRDSQREHVESVFNGSSGER